MERSDVVGGRGGAQLTPPSPTRFPRRGEDRCFSRSSLPAVIHQRCFIIVDVVSLISTQVLPNLTRGLYEQLRPLATLLLSENETNGAECCLTAMMCSCYRLLRAGLAESSLRFSPMAYVERRGQF